MGFLLQRAQDRRHFQRSAVDLSKRKLRRQRHSAAHCNSGLEDWAEAPLAIAGVLGPTAAQSMVRQAILAELRSDALLGGENAAVSTDANCQVDTRFVRGKERTLFGELNQRDGGENRFARKGDCKHFDEFNEMRAAETSFAKARAEEVRAVNENSDHDQLWRPGRQSLRFSDRPREPFSQDDAEDAEEARAPIASASSSDADAEEEAQLLRDCRLDQLRTAILGALAGPHLPEDAQTGAGSADGDAAIVFAQGDLSDLRIKDMHQSMVGHDRVSGNAARGTAFGDGLVDLRLDDMHREALSDLRRRFTTTQNFKE